MVESKRTLIYIDNDDFKLYQDLIKNTDKYFKNNLHLFTCAVLVGKFVVNKPGSFKKKKDYIRVNDNANDQNLIILKSLAISYNDGVSILSDEDKLYSYCERYAITGIKQIWEWYDDNSYDFGTTLSKVLLKTFNELDFDTLK